MLGFLRGQVEPPVAVGTADAEVEGETDRSTLGLFLLDRLGGLVGRRRSRKADARVFVEDSGLLRDRAGPVRRDCAREGQHERVADFDHYCSGNRTARSAGA